MLRDVCKQTLVLANHSKSQPFTGGFLQFVRWRMPRWVLTTPRKLFFIPEKPVVDPEEKEELTRRNRIYNTEMKSLKAYLCKERSYTQMERLRKAKEQKLAKERGKPPTANYLKLMEIHKSWNFESHRRREERIANDTRENAARVAAEQAAADEKLRLEREKALTNVKRAQEEHYLNESNADAYIDTLLKTQNNYNFAIDLEGNRYVELPDESVKKIPKKSAESTDTIS